jgi:hypothetical protein
MPRPLTEEEVESAAAAAAAASVPAAAAAAAVAVPAAPAPAAAAVASALAHALAVGHDTGAALREVHEGRGGHEGEVSKVGIGPQPSKGPEAFWPAAALPRVASARLGDTKV